jgi:hypothetical protein
MHFITAITDSVWSNAFAVYGIRCENSDDGGWRFSGELGQFTQIEVRSVILNAAFGGMSPRDLAARVASLLASGSTKPPLG